ncbi:Cupredoxin [Parasponia andersonii]|uniref:Cupredoxin n=1 Tax=Parasponia andersonii TaxID=3476 RepID=A0A2P5AK00_PARAD|nr:Cupredoxin [Parasponia andersonii]
MVFKYNPPRNNASAYTVYLLPNLWSYITCDFRKAKLLANPKQGGGQSGFVVELNQWRPYYFASNGDNGNHCDDGLMKFFAVPWPRVS